MNKLLTNYKLIEGLDIIYFNIFIINELNKFYYRFMK